MLCEPLQGTLLDNREVEPTICAMLVATWLPGYLASMERNYSERLFLAQETFSQACLAIVPFSSAKEKKSPSPHTMLLRLERAAKPTPCALPLTLPVSFFFPSRGIVFF